MSNREDKYSTSQINIAIGIGAIIAFGMVRFVQSLEPRSKPVKVIKRELQIKLQHAINDERYEDAASYRDQIKSLNTNI